MNELCQTKEADEKVEATLDPMITGCLVYLGLGVVSRTCEVTMIVVTRVGVCPTGGELDCVEGSLEVLNLLL